MDPLLGLAPDTLGDLSVWSRAPLELATPLLRGDEEHGSSLGTQANLSERLYTDLKPIAQLHVNIRHLTISSSILSPHLVEGHEGLKQLTSSSPI